MTSGLPYAKAPLGVVIVNKNNAVLVWCNALVQTFMGRSMTPGEPFMSPEAWATFHDYLEQNRSFFIELDGEGGGCTCIPQWVSNSDEILLWVLPGMIHDVDWQTMYQDLVRQRKLANIGKVVVELAHELSNPLTAISMASQLIGMSLKKLKKQVDNPLASPDTMHDILAKTEQEVAKITEATNRASALREEVLTYSRPNPLHLKPYTLDKLLSPMLVSIMAQPVFRRMTLETHWHSPSAMVLCDASKLEQIIYNLLKNAYDATSGKGSIRVSELVSGSSVVLEIEDNGPGIPEDLLNRIFSPFLTTKPRTGTGLGLSISQQILQKHGGTLSVYNKQGSGACFQIHLPIADQPAHLIHCSRLSSSDTVYS
jgi:signal transduction histidine kinase